MFCRSLAESSGQFWQSEEFESVANPYFENIKHLQNLGHLLMTAPSIYGQYHCIYWYLYIYKKLSQIQTQIVQIIWYDYKYLTHKNAILFD